MKISEYAIKHFHFTLILFLMLIVLGVSTLLTMPRSEDPEVTFPVLSIVAVNPGASPMNLEELVVEPIEQKVSELENVTEVSSLTMDGAAIIFAEFKYGTDIDDNYRELLREVDGLKNKLPRELTSIEVKKRMASSVNIIQLALLSESASIDNLNKYGKLLQKELENVPMLKRVQVSGLPEKVIKIDIDLDKITQMHIPLKSIFNTIQSELTTIPGGSIEAGHKTFNVITTGNFNSLDEICNTAIYSANGKMIPLKEIAKVQYGYESQKHITRLNGHRCIFLTAAQKPGYSISDVQKLYKPIISEFSEKLPMNIDLKQNFDQADNVNKRLNNLGIDLIIAIILVAFTLAPLGLRASSVVMISIPLSLAAGLILLHMFGFNLNQLSIVGFVVALGIIVDDSIVVVENIERWLREGYSRYEAAIKGTKQIGIAVVGCTAIVIIAFLPLLFLPETSGDFIRSLPVAVVTSVFASMIIALTIIPFLSNRILKKETNKEGNIFLSTLQGFIHKGYGRILQVSLKKPFITAGIALIVFVGSLFLIPVIGFSLFPASEKPQFVVNITTPLQSNLSYTNTVTQKVEDVLSNCDDIKYYATNVGRGNPMIYYNLIPENERNDYAQIFIQLYDNTPASRKLEVIEDLRNKFKKFPEAKIEVRNFEQGPAVSAPVEIKLLGENLDSLAMLATKVENILSNTEGTIYVSNPTKNKNTDIRIKINKSKAQLFGLHSRDIYQNVRMAVSGLNMGTISEDDGENYKLLLSTTGIGGKTIDVLRKLFVNNIQGKAIPINQIADFEFETTPQVISHYNKTRMVTLTSFVKKGYLSNNINNEIVSKLNNLDFPVGYSYAMGGELETKEKSFGGFGKIIILTLFLFFAVLILEFKTIKSSCIVLTVIPLGIVGAVSGLFITGYTLSFVAVVGLIALAGIEVKNSILLVDFINQLREKGHSMDDAIREAGEVRFLPIILTSLTSIFGLIPIALSTNPLIAPLAVVIIGGLISSTLLSRIVTPVVYKLLAPTIKTENT